MNRIILNETSYFGAGCRSVIAVEAARRGFKKAFFVTDKDLIKFGVAAEIIKVFDENQLEYIILVKGETDDVYMVGKMAAFQVQNLLIAYKERFDKDNFIKNLLLDNLLLVDIYNRAKKLHIETEVRRCVFIVETKNDRDNNAFETVRNIFSAKTRDFITAVDEKNIILVKEVKNGEGYDELTKTAQVIVDMLNTEAMTKVHVAFGTIVNEIKEVSRSYKEAKMAMDVGKIFFDEKEIIACTYSNRTYYPRCNNNGYNCSYQ